MATVELNEKQLRLIQDALELYSRIGILQIDHILYHPSVEQMIMNQFRPKKDKLEVGDETERGTVVEVSEKYIKTKSYWSDWKDRADEETVKNNPNGWVEEVRTWTDIKDIKLSVDWEQVHKTRDKVKSICSELKNTIANDSRITSPNASYGINRNNEGTHNTDAYDMIQVIRHEFWKANPNRNDITVDSSICKFSAEPLIKVTL